MPDSLLDAAGRALNIASHDSVGPVPPIARFGPLLLLAASATVVVLASAGVIPGGAVAATLSALSGLAGFWVRHQA